MSCIKVSTLFVDFVAFHLVYAYIIPQLKEHWKVLECVHRFLNWLTV